MTFVKNNISNDIISYLIMLKQQSTSGIGEVEIAEILKLEDLFHNRYLTPQLLSQLISLYVRAVEVFNQEFFFMKKYFLDKMQFLVSRPEIMQMLQKSSGQNGPETIRETVRFSQRASQSQKKQEEKRKYMVHHKPEHAHNYFYDQEKHKQRDLKINRQIKLMREVEKNVKIFQKQVEKVDKKHEKQEIQIKNITKNQNNKLEERLAKRKKRIRKKSFQLNKPKEDQEEAQPVIQKQELIQAQRQLTQAITRYTIRLTLKNLNSNEFQKGSNEGKGRIKMDKIEEEEDEEKIREITGRIKTRRDQSDELEEW